MLRQAVAISIAGLVGVTPAIANAQSGPGVDSTDGNAAPSSAVGSPAPSSGPAPGDASGAPNESSTAPAASSAPPSDPNALSPGMMAALRRLLDGFSFGSYGRVAAAADLRGHWGRAANIVAHGTRIDEDTYAEVELHRDDDFGPVHTRVVFTLAMQGPLFHETGTFNANLAIRNLYVEERGAILPGLAVWVGSRMYRGDDAYLLNWWPLDNLNTVGGGARYDFGNAITVAAHVGLNRLDSNYQYQQISVVPRDGVGAAQVILLNRPRTIASLKATWWLNGRNATSGLKVSLYGEAHVLPEGIRQNTDNGRLEQLPGDTGFVVGGQVGVYTGVRATHANVWFRYAQGLAAYGDLAVPYTLSAMQTSARAQDVVLAASGNWEWNFFGIMAAGYVRYFRDADPAVYGRNELLEGTLVVRPNLWLGQYAGVALEGSYQALEYNMIDPVTGVGPRMGSEWRFAVMPYITPAGRGNYTRPHLRLIYALTVRDSGAQRFYAPDDSFSRNALEHFLGVSCEWWFNSSYM